MNDAIIALISLAGGGIIGLAMLRLGWAERFWKWRP